MHITQFFTFAVTNTKARWMFFLVFCDSLFTWLVFKIWRYANASLSFLFETENNIEVDLVYLWSIGGIFMINFPHFFAFYKITRLCNFYQASGATSKTNFFCAVKYIVTWRCSDVEVFSKNLWLFSYNLWVF